MKILNLLVVLGLSLSLGVLTGCSNMKSGKGRVAGQEGVQATGLGDQEGFGEDGYSTVNRLKAPYNQSYHFDFDKYDVKYEDIASINVQANYLVTHDNAKVRLEGNADERGSREYNIALGWKRAKAVAEILKQQGVKDCQIAMVSYGKEKPIAFGHDEDAYAKNRRTDLIYEAK